MFTNLMKMLSISRNT